jgi:hemerythrin-like domain-containing protein
MASIELLAGEHMVIRQVLACLERLAQSAGRRETLDVISTLQALDFLRHFAHGCHQEKEERLLFPLLEARGFPHEGGPTALLRGEHAEACRHLRAMAATVEVAAIGQPDAMKRFVTSAWAYVALARDHLRKEDHGLFPVAGRYLSRADQRELLAGFMRLEAALGEGIYEDYLATADALAARCNVHGLAAEAGLGAEDLDEHAGRWARAG